MRRSGTAWSSMRVFVVSANRVATDREHVHDAEERPHDADHDGRLQPLRHHLADVDGLLREEQKRRRDPPEEYLHDERQRLRKKARGLVVPLDPSCRLPCARWRRTGRGSASGCRNPRKTMTRATAIRHVATPQRSSCPVRRSMMSVGRCSSLSYGEPPLARSRAASGVVRTASTPNAPRGLGGSRSSRGRSPAEGTQTRRSGPFRSGAEDLSPRVARHPWLPQQR